MKNNMTKNKKIQNQKNNDLLMNRLMLEFIIAVLGVTLIMCVKNATTFEQMYEWQGKAMMFGSLVLFVCATAAAVLRFVRRTDDVEKVITKWSLLGTGILCLASAVAYKINPGIASALVVSLILCATLLYFIYHIYDFSFFAIAAFCVSECYLLYVSFAIPTVRTVSNILQLLFRIGAVALPLIFALACVVIFNKQKMKDKLAFGGVAVCAAIGLLGAVLLLLPSLVYISYLYVLLAIVVLFVVIGITYTVRLIE